MCLSSNPIRVLVCRLLFLNSPSACCNLVKCKGLLRLISSAGFFFVETRFIVTEIFKEKILNQIVLIKDARSSARGIPLRTLYSTEVLSTRISKKERDNDEIREEKEERDFSSARDSAILILF